MLRAVLTLIVALVASVAGAQTPQSLPLVHLADVAQVGSFTVPQSVAESSPRGMIGLGADGVSAYFTCHVWYNKLARVSIPAFGQAATVLDGCADVPNLNGINPLDVNAKRIGGALWWNGRLTVSGYSYYDGAQTAVASHFYGPNVAGLTGPYALAGKPPGWVAGPMTPIPQEWRALFGGPVLTGNCCLAIIDRTSYGMSVSVFDPDKLGATTAPATLLVGYDSAHLTLGAWNSQGALGFNGNTVLGKIAFVPGTRTVAFFGQHALNFCYGSGTSDKALAGKSDGQGNIYCYDPGNDSKGVHGYPLQDWAWLYDANDLLAVKQGAKQPWEVKPYEQGPSPAGGPGGFYDPAKNRLYVGSGNIRVYSIGTGAPPPPPPPPPVDCDGVWTESLSEPTPLVCDATQLQTRTRTKTFTVTQPPSVNPPGKACPVSPVITTETSACVFTEPPPPPPPPPNVCVTTPLVVTVQSWPGVSEGARALRYTATVAGATVQMAELRHIWTAPQRLLVTDNRSCSVTVTRP